MTTTGDPVASQPVDVRVQLGLGADVDARGGLVEDKHAGAGRGKLER